MAGVSEFVSNNNGKLPANGTSSAAGDAQTVFNNANVKNITTLVVESTNTTAPSATQAVLKKGFKCSAAITSGFVSTGVSAGSSRQYALLYPMEDKAGDATGCIDS